MIVPANAPFETRVKDGLFSLTFSEVSAEAAPPTVADLYSRLFPIGTEPPAEAAAEEDAKRTKKESSEVETRAPFHLGRVGIRPYATLSYIDADTATGDPPVFTRDSYVQLQPGVAADAPLGLGQVTVSYEPRLRAFSSVAAVQETTHWLNGTVNLPVGPRVLLQGTAHYSKGILEATEVDPGGEYFFDLGPYEHVDFGGNAQVEVSPRLRVDVGATLSDVNVTSDAFFSHRGQTAHAELSYEVNPNLRAEMGYAWNHVPQPADRPEAEATAHGLTFGLTGEIAPLTSGRIDLGYSAQDNPNAGPGGQSYHGLTAGISVRRTIGHDSALDLGVRRNLTPSAFQDDGFYIVTMTDAVYSRLAPFSTTLRIGVGYQWSDYRTDASGLGEPRADRIFAWYVGASRSFGEHISLRADYRHDRRQSNLPGFSFTTDAVVVQLGLGWFGGASR
jgi:hypothetical protein